MLQSSSYSLRLYVQTVSCKFLLTLSMCLGGLDHSPVLPSKPLGQGREITWRRRQLRLWADWILLRKCLFLLKSQARAQQEGDRFGASLQAFEHAAEKTARSLHGVSWCGSSCGAGMQATCTWGGEGITSFSLLLKLIWRGGNCRGYLLSGKADLKSVCLKPATVWATLTCLNRHVRPHRLTGPHWKAGCLPAPEGFCKGMMSCQNTPERWNWYEPCLAFYYLVAATKGPI